jgi:large subunit ribosomal protein L18
VFRSNNHIYAQIIDDSAHHTLAAASTLDPDLRAEIGEIEPCEASSKVGALLAQRALAKGIQKVVFDRGGKLYHGRVKALADGAREAGLEF